MTHLAAATVDTSGLSDRVVSWLRTIVPGAWAALITWALGRWPAAGTWLDTLGVDLSSVAVQSVVVTLVLGAWYAAWRWAEPRLPAWATRLVLGASRAPTYGVTTAGAAAMVGVLTAAQRADLAALAESLGPDDPAALAVAALGITSTTA